MPDLKIPGLKDTTEEFAYAMERVGKFILRAMAAALKLEVQ